MFVFGDNRETPQTPKKKRNNIRRKITIFSLSRLALSHFSPLQRLKIHVRNVNLKEGRGVSSCIGFTGILLILSVGS
jgi:hypothetical protein